LLLGVNQRITKKLRKIDSLLLGVKGLKDLLLGVKD
jgi:hypothetical protein